MTVRNQRAIVVKHCMAQRDYAIFSISSMTNKILLPVLSEQIH